MPITMIAESHTMMLDGRKMDEKLARGRDILSNLVEYKELTKSLTEAKFVDDSRLAGGVAR